VDFLHKVYAATMDGKGREGTYIFVSRRLRAAGGEGVGHRAQGRGSCHPAGDAHVYRVYFRAVLQNL